jgi:16S rRNA (cytidine1402-2'-O)-methyltransferase
MSKGCLFLIPTPLNSEDQLDPKTLQLLQSKWQSSTILVEDHKVARRRWILWGLDRSAIEKFELFNEHNQTDGQTNNSCLSKLAQGQDVLLFCDEGLPAFCDPGEKLVRACRESRIEVKVVSFNQSKTAPSFPILLEENQGNK